MVRNSWLGTWKGELRVACFPHAGATTGAYVNLLRDRVPGAAVVRVPGRPPQEGVGPPPTVAEVARGVASRIEAAGRERIVLWGHSIGAVLATETCRQLEQGGLVLPVLVVSGRDYGLPTTAPGSDAALQELLLRHGGTPAQVLDDEELLRLALDWLRFDLSVVATSVTRRTPFLSAAMVVAYGREDPDTTVDGVAGWAGVTRGSVEVVSRPGGHFFPWTDPKFVPLLSEVTDRHLEGRPPWARHADPEGRLR